MDFEFHKNNSGNIVMNGSQRYKTGGSLMNQFPLYFLMMDNEHGASLSFNFVLLIFHHRYAATKSGMRP